MVVDREAWLGIDSIGAGTPIFSPDSKHVAYEAKKGEKWILLVDGQSGMGIGSLIFSPDGKRVAYMAVKGKKPIVVVDGKGWGAKSRIW